MNTKRTLTLGITLITMLLITALTTGSALASEGTEYEVEGTVVGMDEDEKTINLDVEGEILVVKVAGNFDFEVIAIGDLIEAKGTLGEDGTLVLSEYKIQDRIRDRVKEQDGDGDASFCVSSDKVHPVADSIAETYSTAYKDIMSWFCGEENHAGLGQIILALQTAALNGDVFDSYLVDREDGMGWGQIWQELGEKGKPDHGTPPGQIKKQDGENYSEEKVPPGQMKKNGEEIECTEELALLGLCEIETPVGKQKGKNK